MLRARRSRKLSHYTGLLELAEKRTTQDFVRRRLVSQRLVGNGFVEPQQVVGWLGAVQAQDYAGAKWAVGQRLATATDDDIERAFNAGEILRTHVLRPTWHFVLPADIQWLLMLTAPRVHAANASMYRKLGIDAVLVKRSQKAFFRALSGGKSLTREELRVVLDRDGVSTSGELRMGYIMMHAELDGVVCSGPRRGKQFTYALLEERIRSSRTLGRGEALAELGDRYFRSRGPATAHDFAKWSGLTVTDSRTGLEAVKHRLECDVVDRNEYWFATSKPVTKLPSVTAHLLSIYDEYISGYKDRSAVVSAGHAKKLVAMGNALTGIVLVNGLIAGSWKRGHDKDRVMLRIESFTQLTKLQTSALRSECKRLGRFLGKDVVLEVK